MPMAARQPHVVGVVMAGCLGLLVMQSAKASSLDGRDWSYRTNSFNASAASPCGRGEAEACGTNNWNYLSSYDSSRDYECTTSQQSPINIASATPSSSLSALELNSGAGCYNVTLEGVLAHSWEVLYEECEEFTLEWGGTEYVLQQFHFHSPSEHTFGGGYYDAEAHLVHKSDDGEYLVIGILMDASSEYANNSFLQPLWQRGFPVNESEEEFHDSVDPYAGLMPASPNYYTYTGSFTTPPCTTDVTWIIMEQIVSLSDWQVNVFRSGVTDMANTQVRSGDTNRPLQAVADTTAVSSFNGNTASTDDDAAIDDDSDSSSGDDGSGSSAVATVGIVFAVVAFFGVLVLIYLQVQTMKRTGALASQEEGGTGGARASNDDIEMQERSNPVLSSS